MKALNKFGSFTKSAFSTNSFINSYKLNLNKTFNFSTFNKFSRYNFSTVMSNSSPEVKVRRLLKYRQIKLLALILFLIMSTMRLSLELEVQV